MRRVAILLLLFAIRTSAQQQSTVQGIVVDALTNNPIARASIELRDLGSNPSPVTRPGGTDPVTPGYPALTTENGQFVLRNIPPGRYSLVASHAGYVHGEYGQHGPNGKALVLTVPAGKSISGIRLVMEANAAIAGHAYDSKGAPLAYVQMQARRVTYPFGQFTMTPTSSTVTDDLGAYRLYGLPPGQYVLSAETYTNSVGIIPVTASQTPPVPGVVMSGSAHGPMLTDTDPANQNRRRDSGLTIFYPNAIDPVDAKLMELRAGEDVRGIDVTLGSVRAAAAIATGTIARDASSADTIVDLSVIATATQTIRARLGFPGSGRGNAGPAPAAVNLSLPPGGYLAVAMVHAGSDLSSAAYSYFSVGLTPVSFNLVMAPTPKITGHVTIEGRSASSESEFSKMRITFTRNPMVPSATQQAGATVRNDGTFSSDGVLDGEYSFSIAGFPDSLRNAYVKSVKGTNVEVIGDRVRLPAQPSAAMDVEIVLGMNGGQISGVAAASNGDALSNVTVLLVPDAPTAIDRRDQYRSTVTDADGRYRFDHLPPGDYRLFSWEDVEPDIWFNTAFMSSLRDLGRTIRVAEGAQSDIKVAAIPIR